MDSAVAVFMKLLTTCDTSSGIISSIGSGVSNLSTAGKNLGPTTGEVNTGRGKDGLRNSES